MGTKPSVGTYGNVFDISTSDFVECLCGQRFVGGDFASRLSRWSRHSDSIGCKGAKARENDAE